MTPLKQKELFLIAQSMLVKAYAPYSNFQVGAALLAQDGSIHTGCNVENASFSAGICAERTALVKAITAGNREFVAIAVAGSQGAPTPCGVCRQMLNEFAPELIVIWGTNENQLQATPLSHLLLHAFGPKNLI
ncbi:MAG: cytidine deaminase [Symbiobacteriaceae bacterium]|nr:cytidine deaminase [Symbiobacteriaceae bacterium]